MKKNNSVIFKGKKDGITILLDASAPFHEIKSVLRDKLIDGKRFFQDGKSAITFKGRNLSDAEEQELLDVFTSNSDINLTFTQTVADDAQILEITRAAPELDQSDAISDAIYNPAYFHTEGLRSGQSVRYAGSVIVMGDVNPGAEIVAEGNIIVMGTLKGMAHAGCFGCPGCFIAAMSLQPAQIRIGVKITYLPQEYINVNNLSGKALYAYIKDEQIHITPLGNA